MSKSFKISVPKISPKGRLDAGPTIKHKNHSRYARNKETGWNEYYAELENDVHDDFISDFQEE